MKPMKIYTIKDLLKIWPSHDVYIIDALCSFDLIPLRTLFLLVLSVSVCNHI